MLPTHMYSKSSEFPNVLHVLAPRTMTGEPAKYAAIAAARVPLNFGSLDFIANLAVVLQADVPVIDCVIMMIASSAPTK